MAYSHGRAGPPHGGEGERRWIHFSRSQSSTRVGRRAAGRGRGAMTSLRQSSHLYSRARSYPWR